MGQEGRGVVQYEAVAEVDAGMVGPGGSHRREPHISRLGMVAIDRDISRLSEVRHVQVFLTSGALKPPLPIAREVRKRLAILGPPVSPYHAVAVVDTVPERATDQRRIIRDLIAPHEGRSASLPIRRHDDERHLKLNLRPHIRLAGTVRATRVGMAKGADRILLQKVREDVSIWHRKMCRPRRDIAKGHIPAGLIDVAQALAGIFRQGVGAQRFDRAGRDKRGVVDQSGRGSTHQRLAIRAMPGKARVGSTAVTPKRA